MSAPTPPIAPPPRHLRVFLASPGDVAEERRLAQEVLNRLPDDPVFQDRITLRTIAWDQPGAGPPLLATLTPQQAIAQGLPKPSECDIVIVILWSRLGTPLPPEWTRPDGSRYRSGTEWEYEDARQAAEHGRPKLLLYRRTEKVLLDPDDPEFDENSRQWRLVKDFFAALRNPDGSIRGGWNEYATPLQFKDELTTHLRALLLELAPELRPSSPGAGAVSAPPTPLPALENIHGWPATQVQARQQQTAQALKIAVAFRDTLKDGRPGPEMVVIPAGEFLMGSPEGEAGRANSEGPQNIVVIAKPFAMGRYAVTFDEYDRFCQATKRIKPAAEGRGRGRQPVINVTWEDSIAYCAWLSEQTGAVYRLPTEAEWEYAAQAGTTTAQQRVQVKSFQPNPFGLYQVHGEIFEWVQEDWQDNYDGPLVLESRAWYFTPRFFCSLYRMWESGSEIYPGFRLARTFPF